MAESLKTPNKRGRPKTKRDRPDPIRGFECHSDVNDFVRGAIWVLHTQGNSLLDIAAAVRVCNTTVGYVVNQCEDGDFLKPPTTVERTIPAAVIERRKYVAKLRNKDKQASSPEIARQFFADYDIDVSWAC